jgi:hypothetical protein
VTACSWLTLVDCNFLKRRQSENKLTPGKEKAKGRMRASAPDLFLTGVRSRCRDDERVARRKTNLVLLSRLTAVSADRARVSYKFVRLSLLLLLLLLMLLVDGVVVVVVGRRFRAAAPVRLRPLARCDTELVCSDLSVEAAAKRRRRRPAGMHVASASLSRLGRVTKPKTIPRSSSCLRAVGTRSSQQVRERDDRLVACRGGTGSLQ